MIGETVASSNQENPSAWRKPDWRIFLISAVPAGLLFWVLYPLDALTGVDGAYHLRMGEDFPLLAWRGDFPWLRWTHYRESYVNYHLGFHLLIWLWTQMTAWAGVPLSVAANGLVLMAAGLNGWALGSVIKRYGPVTLLAGALLFFFLPWHFWLRHSYLRAFILTSALLLLVVDRFIEEDARAVFLLSWLCMFTYNIAILFAVILPLLVFSFWLFGRLRSGIRMGLFSGFGVLAGLIVHPHFPENIHAIWLQLTEIALPAPGVVGSEWKPVQGDVFISTAAPLLLLLGAAVLYRLIKGPPLGLRSTALFLLQGLFLVLTLRTRRTYEYWPLFALWLCLDLAHPWLEQRTPLRSRAVQVSGGILVVLLGMLYFQDQNVGRIRHRPIQQDLRAAHFWLQENTPQGNCVMLDDWDEFPGAFGLNIHNTYPVGLDPMYTAKPFPAKWDLFRQITRGRGEDRLSEIYTELECRYVLVRHGSERLYRQLEASENFERVFPPSPPPGKTVYGRPGASVFRFVGTLNQESTQVSEAYP